ncbi:MAG: DM13 domain-containing protein [Ardenticatenaceae bacterium]|nr:DM13 domain-containing protein [Ardenticatenaceae bacterium]
MNRRNLIIGAIIVLILASPVVWWLASPLFIQNEVNEDFPFDVPTAAEIEAMSAEEAETAAVEIMEQVEGGEMNEDDMAMLEDTVMEIAAKMPDKEMVEEMPDSAAEWVVAGSGMFRDFDAFHQGSGTATIFQQGEQRVLRFEDFEVTNGPDLHVLLVENVDATGQDDIGEYIDLGSLKGNIGDQNYEIPADVDLSQFSGVMIYCMPFHVVFSTAPLG